MASPERDLIIIGSGPAGLTAAIYSARAQLRPVVLEGSVTAGGALMNTTEVENYPGFTDGIQGPDLMAAMREQAEKFGAEILTDDAVEIRLGTDSGTGVETGVAERGQLATVIDGSGVEHRARAVILAMGSGYRELGLPNEKRLAGHGVSWCATCDGFFFRGQEIAVVGGGDSAMEEADFLTRFASRVTIVHRRDEFRASRIMVDRVMANPKIDVAWDSQVVDVLGADQVEGLRLRNKQSGDERDLPVSGVFIAIGHDPRSELVRGKVELDAEGYVQVAHPTTATSVPGVFACGDLVDRHYRQAITAAGSGCAAALDAERWLADHG